MWIPSLTMVAEPKDALSLFHWPVVQPSYAFAEPPGYKPTELGYCKFNINAHLYNWDFNNRFFYKKKTIFKYKK